MILTPLSGLTTVHNPLMILNLILRFNKKTYSLFPDYWRHNLVTWTIARLLPWLIKRLILLYRRLIGWVLLNLASKSSDSYGLHNQNN